MALPTQMNEDERGIMALNGLTGGIIATVLLLSILAVLTISAISVQQANAENYYEINQDLNGLKMNSPENHKMWVNK
jgi:cell division protein FtsN